MATAWAVAKAVSMWMPVWVAPSGARLVVAARLMEASAAAAVVVVMAAVEVRHEAKVEMGAAALDVQRGAATAAHGHYQGLDWQGTRQ